MKKSLIFLIFGMLLSIDSPAQDILNSIGRVLNGLSQQGQQRNNQRNNNQRSNNQRNNYQRTYPNYQNNDRQEILYQQRRNQQRNNQRAYQNNQSDEMQGRLYRPNRDKSSAYEQQNNDIESSKYTNGLYSSKIDCQSQESDKTVTLVTNGTGKTKEEATRNALRSAIEQAFGTFVSANTEVLNDELIKDEIVTVTSGNVKSYKELSVSQMEDGSCEVSVQAIVSIDQLTNFAQSKGFRAELSGASIVMKMKMYELNRKNEIEAISHLMEKAKSIANRGLFDYETKIGDVQKYKDNYYKVPIKILFLANENTTLFYNTIYNTVKALGLSEIEMKEYEKVNIPYYTYNTQLAKNSEYGKEVFVVLRNDYSSVEGYRFLGVEGTLHPISWMMPIFITYLTNFVVRDNLDNQIICGVSKYPSNNIVWSYVNNGTKINYSLLSEWKSAKNTAPTITDHLSLESCLIDFGYPGFNSDPLTFNPTMPLSDHSKSLAKERERTGCYFQLQFYIYYTEEEFFRFTDIITVNR